MHLEEEEESQKYFLEVGEKQREKLSQHQERFCVYIHMKGPESIHMLKNGIHSINTS